MMRACSDEEPQQVGCRACHVAAGMAMPQQAVCGRCRLCGGGS